MIVKLEKIMNIVISEKIDVKVKEQIFLMFSWKLNKKGYFGKKREEYQYFGILCQIKGQLCDDVLSIGLQGIKF